MPVKHDSYTNTDNCVVRSINISVSKKMVGNSHLQCRQINLLVMVCWIQVREFFDNRDQVTEKEGRCQI